MTTEANAAPDVAADTATSEQIANTQPEVASPESNEVEQQPQEKHEGDDSDKSLKRLQRRVDRVTAARYQAEAEARQLRERLASIESRQQTQEEPASFRPEDVEAIAAQKAEEIATVKEVAKRSNEAFSEGLKAFGETFKASVAEVIDEAGELIDRRGMPTALGEAILDSDKPAELLHFLGQNPDIAADLRGLSAARLGRRIAAIERDMSATKVSKAPQPLQPVTAKGAPVVKAEKQMTDAEWYAQRRKERLSR